MSLASIPDDWQADPTNPGGLPLLSLPQSQTSHDPVLFAERLKPLLPVRSCDPLNSDRPFQVHSGGLRVGAITVLSNWGSGLTGRVEDMEDAQLIVPYVGTGLFHLGSSRCENRAGSTLIYLPGGDWRVSTDVLAGVVLRVPRDAIAAVRRVMAGPTAVREPAVALEAHRLLQRDEGEHEALFINLYRTLGLLNSAVLSHGSLPENLRLDDLLIRLVALLLGPLPREAIGGSAARGEPFEALIEWIDANCHRPLSLSDLEHQSHYSRRSLQYSFRHRFGCGPMQYIRRQRLDLAKRRLLAPMARTTITSVAMECGYLSVASFRRDYQQRYGESPSAVLRRMRSVPPSRNAP